MKKILRSLLSVLAILVFVAPSAADAAAKKPASTVAAAGAPVTPDCGAGDYGIMN